MKHSILSRACLVALSMCALAFAAVPASAQDSSTLYGHAQFGPNKTVDLLNARIVDMTPGAQKVTDFNGVVHTGAFVNDTAFLNSEFQQRYARRAVEPNIWYNVSVMSGSECIANQSVLKWNGAGGAQSFNDACTRVTAIHDRSRR